MVTAPHPLVSHQRQIHLDFHTAPGIRDVGVEFDARAFAARLKAAHVTSVTIFAKCHHGMCYYPSTVGTPHPALAGRDLLGEQIEALHREGIRCPIYTTVAWDEVAALRPEWRQMTADGTFARCANPDASRPAQPGGWWYNNFLHPGYQEHLEAQVRELFSRYGALDGLFFDILFFHPQACWSDASRRFRAVHGLEGRDRATQVRFEGLAQASFARRFTDLVQSLSPTSTLFYNSHNPVFTDGQAGVRTRHHLQTHWELESLPSGFWGYHHFPRLARSFGQWGKPWLGMTGRFQRMWGDFGGLKPQAALEYECFRTQALGGACSIGDQLPPRGRLDEGAYRLIGNVYAQWEAAEPFYADTRPLAQIGIVAPGSPNQDQAQTDLSLEGAVQMCEEAHYEAVVLDDASDFTGQDLVILPDSVEITDALRERLTTHLAAGGKLLLSDRSGFAADGTCCIPGLPLRRLGAVPFAPTYWRVAEDLEPDLAVSDRVIYQPGSVLAGGAGVVSGGTRVLPYFPRTDLTFCSHAHAPPRATAEEHPAILLGDRFVAFADPIFREYRQHGNTAVRDAWRAALRRLIGPSPIGDGLPTTILACPRRHGDDLRLTLLHFIPTRKALDGDMIEERSSFAGEILRLPEAVAEVRTWPTGASLPRTPEGFVLPAVKGRLLLEVPGFFAAGGPGASIHHDRGAVHPQTTP